MMFRSWLSRNTDSANIARMLDKLTHHSLPPRQSASDGKHVIIVNVELVGFVFYRRAISDALSAGRRAFVMDCG